MTAIHSRYVSVDRIRTHYLEAGAGPPVVLFHSGEFGGAAEISWEFTTGAGAAFPCHRARLAGVRADRQAL